MFPHSAQILNAFLILGTGLLLILSVSLWLIKKKSKVFYFNKTTLGNHLKKTPITEEMYFFLQQLAQQGRVDNTLLLEYFQGQHQKTLDSIIKKKNKMIGTFFDLQETVFSTTIVKKIKDPKDHRQVIYALNKNYKIQETT